MKVHPRTWIVQQASIRINTAVTEAIAQSAADQLTHTELTGILGQILLDWNRYAIRDEREAKPQTEHQHSWTDLERSPLSYGGYVKRCKECLELYSCDDNGNILPPPTCKHTYGKPQKAESSPNLYLKKCSRCGFTLNCNNNGTQETWHYGGE